MKPKTVRPANQYIYDPTTAGVVVKFFEHVLTHVKGPKAGLPFVLDQWQQNDIIKPLFGWIDPKTGLRRFKTCYVEIPRKNGKSTLAAGIALYLLFIDPEEGAEIFSAAADRDQAAIIFDIAKQMVKQSPILEKSLQVYKRAIINPDTFGVYKVLSAEAFSKHGLNASGIIFDELHAQPNRELWDVLTTSTAARAQPLTLALTTAGWDTESICYEQHLYSKQVETGIIEDSSHLSVIYGNDKESRYDDPEAWANANPGLGISVRTDYLERQAEKAKFTPALQNTFKRLHLNIWTQQADRWLDLDKWDQCGVDPINESMLHGGVCYGGLDLSSVTDLTSLVLAFPSDDERGIVSLLPFFWIPEDQMRERVRRDRVNYDVWVQQGLMRTTPGDVIDYQFIIADIEKLGELFDIREIAFDRWGAFQASTTLEGLGFNMIGFGQGFASMSPPTKELLQLVLSKKIQHGGHKVLRWNAANMVVKTDPAGNIKPDKSKSTEKIDGIVASIMAIDRTIRNTGTKRDYSRILFL